MALSFPPGVIKRIVELLEPEEVWLFGSRARETHGPDSDWDFLAVLPIRRPKSGSTSPQCGVPSASYAGFVSRSSRSGGTTSKRIATFPASSPRPPHARAGSSMYADAKRKKPIAKLRQAANHEV